MNYIDCHVVPVPRANMSTQPMSFLIERFRVAAMAKGDFADGPKRRFAPVICGQQTAKLGIYESGVTRDA